MTSSLPAGIAAYLQEAGFSGTEIAVIRKLLEGEALTLRELSSKTGKSTGVLDQAVKKLLKKGLIIREMINTTPRYSLISVQTVVGWMKEDMLLKQEMLVRKHQNLESFVRSLTVTEKKRPEMEFFEGADAIKHAYLQLLERGNDIIQYGPVLWAAHEDPFHAFWVEYFRERRRRGIFSRVLTNDTPLGRRYQSRDPFEYRKTILVDRSEFPFHFEKIVIGDTLGCFQLEDERACFIRFPEFAQDERIFFERIWNRQVQQSAPQPEKDPSPPQEYQEAILVSSAQPSFGTRTLSQVREFFLSRKSIATLAIFGVCALLVTTALYRVNVARNVQSIREKALSIAATAAVQFDADDLNALRTIDDIHKSEYKKVIYQLNLIRNQHSDVTYAYVLRPTSDPNIWEFVADADSIDPFARNDLNEDGVIDSADHLSPPGEKYDALPPGIDARLAGPTVSAEPYQDQWGTWYSGFAPIRNAQNELIAIVGIDIASEEAYPPSRQFLFLISSFLGIFILLIIIRLVVFYGGLCQELWAYRQKMFIPVALITTVILMVSAYSYHIHSRMLIREQVGRRLMAVATVAAAQINAEDLDVLRFARDMQREEYQRVFDQLNEIRRNNSEIRYLYIWRPTESEGIWEFVVDADSNYFIPFEGITSDSNGTLTEVDENLGPGVRYDIAHSAPDIYRDGLRKSTYAIGTVTDQWGTYITGSSPIYDKEGKAVAVLGMDVLLETIR